MPPRTVVDQADLTRCLMLGEEVTLAVSPRADFSAVELRVRAAEPLVILVAAELAARLGHRLLDCALAAGRLLPRERAP
jgi:hypothetical protein